jgi:hypothetical protein
MCPELTTISNTKQKSMLHFLTVSKFSQIPFVRNSFPRLGSFEVYFRGQLVYSKLAEGRWPNPIMVANKIRSILDGVFFSSQAAGDGRVGTAVPRSRSAKSLGQSRGMQKVTSEAFLTRGSEFAPEARPNGHRNREERGSVESAGQAREEQEKKKRDEVRIREEEEKRRNEEENRRNEEENRRVEMDYRRVEEERRRSEEETRRKEEEKKRNDEENNRNEEEKRRSEDEKKRKMMEEDKAREERMKKENEEKEKRDKLSERVNNGADSSRKQAVDGKTDEHKTNHIDIESFKQHPVSQTFNIPIRLGEEINKKFPLSNDEEEEKIVTVQVSNPIIIKLQSEEVRIPPKSKNFVKFTCSVSSVGEFEAILLFKSKDQVFECYKLILQST